MSNPRIATQLSDALPALPPFDNHRILVQLIVNVECWRFDAPMPRKLLGSPHGRDNVPDIPNFSWVEYGMRAGLPRLIRELSERGIPASASMNASVITVYPHAAQAIAEAGWEFIGHGVSQQSLPGSDDEVAVVTETLETMQSFTGRQPRGWLGPGLAETMATPDVLSAAGIDYVCDWVVDDVPVWLHASPHPLVAIPYTLELNDSVLYAAQWHSIEEYERRLAATLDLFEEECRRAPRVLSVALHPHLIGVPHRFAGFRRMLDRLQESAEVVFVTGEQTSDWFRAACPEPGVH